MLLAILGLGITALIGSGVYAACNFLAWTRDAVCEFTCAADAVGAGKTLVDCDGNAVPCSIADNGDGTVKVVFAAKALPPMGMKAYRFAEANAVSGECAVVTEADGAITLDDCINDQVINEFKAADLNTLSPFECMSFLFDLKKRLQ